MSLKSRPRTTRTHKKGFTLVEVSIATAFIAVLMIVIVVIIMNVASIYQKGLTMKTLNSVGRSVVDDITKAIDSTSTTNTIGASQQDVTSGAAKYSWPNDYYRTDNDNSPTMGVFCTGQYSYIWADQSHTGHKSVILKYGNGERSNIRLLKVQDPIHRVCNEFHTSSYTISISDINISDSSIEELLADTDIDLYVQEFYVEPVNGTEGTEKNQTIANRGEVFFSGYFTLGTSRGGKEIFDNDINLSNCESQDDDYNYCAINKFKFAVSTAGKVYK